MSDSFFRRMHQKLRPKDNNRLKEVCFEDFFFRMPVQETPRLLLRPLKMSDAKDVFAYSCDREVARHVLWEPHESIGQSRAFLRYVLRQYRNGEPSSYGIVLKETGKIVGTIGFMWISMENSSAEVGYSLARPYWNRGLMTEALAAVLEVAFQILRLNRVEAQHETDNPASGRVMCKAGMRREGTLRGRLFNKGHFVDVDVYGILREDWLYKRAEL